LSCAIIATAVLYFLGAAVPGPLAVLIAVGGRAGMQEIYQVAAALKVVDEILTRR
jgi:hypothetical protein